MTTREKELQNAFLEYYDALEDPKKANVLRLKVDRLFDACSDDEQDEFREWMMEPQ